MTCEYKAFHSDLTNSEKQPDCSDYFEEEKKVVKAYKGFNRDMTCRGFQFEEGKTYTLPEGEEPELCKRGFHACLDPLDCLRYYGITNSVFHEVELEGVVEKKDRNDTKICGKTIKIGAEIDIDAMIDISIKNQFDKLKSVSDLPKNKNDNVNLASSGDYANLTSSEKCANFASSGKCAKLTSSGDYAQLTSSGYGASLASSGDYAQLTSSGDYAQLTSSGYNANLASSGISTRLASSGTCTKLECLAENGVAAAIGKNSRIKGRVGTWITLAEYGEWNGKCYPCKRVKSVMIDGEKIKADTWYKLENGEFVEVEE